MACSNWLAGYQLRSPGTIREQGLPAAWVTAFNARLMKDPWWIICFLQEVVEHGPAAVKSLSPAKYYYLEYLVELGLIHHGARLTH